MIEILEPRRLLASYTIDGTSGDDSILIDASTTFGVTTYYVTVNGQTSTLGPTNPAGNALTVNAKQGNDNVTVLHEGFGEVGQLAGKRHCHRPERTAIHRLCRPALW